MAQAQASFLPDPVPTEEPVTPLMGQYLALKAQNKDCLLFFRLGDFYELFFEDAKAASKALDIALTRRGQHQGQDIPMCGVPAHSHEAYLAKLIRKGFRVAICEQIETPEDAKKRGAKSIVTRDVVRIITPGTLTEEALLDSRSANYLACVAGAGDELAVSWLDVTSGIPFTQSLTRAELSGALARIDPSEILIPQRLLEHSEFFESFLPWRDKLVPQANSRFDNDNARRLIEAIYHVKELSSFGDFSRHEITALGALLDYVQLTQKSDVKHLSKPEKRSSAQTVIIDPATRRNLELTKTLTGERQGSLLATIDRTETGPGARLLALQLEAPLTDVTSIEKRLDAIQFLTQERDLLEKLRKALKQSPDLERALARLSLDRGGPRDLASVREALKQAATMRSALETAREKMPIQLLEETKSLGHHSNLISRLERALAADLPMLARDGNFMARGYAPGLDELVALRDDNRKLIAHLQQNYAERSDTPTLKIRHNQVIGYYIEVTPTHADKLLAQKELFIHRQSLATAIRFTTIELGELEQKITEAADKARALEMQLFADLVADVLGHLKELKETAFAMAACDVHGALAFLAAEQNYNRPVVDQSLSFDIKGGRHPVVEQALKTADSSSSFIANDCNLAPHQRLWVLTGPNMAGKSTFLRQNAIIALLAQMGSFVPATSAHIGTIDRLFSRVGAADDLARGRSTFMVEMVETAAILNQATDRALVILDEIGRGTATYDGLSIAWATIEHLHDVNRCRALFATHYHELTALRERLKAVSCYTMRIKEWQKEIIFMHEVIEGTADRSYGIHVAQMAGLPWSVIVRAEEVLHEIEKSAERNKTANLALDLSAFNPSAQRQRAGGEMPDELGTLLATLDPDGLTPKEAIEILYQIKALTIKS